MMRLSRATWLPEGWSPERMFAGVFLFGSLLRVAVLFAVKGVPFVSDAGDYLDASRLLLSGVHFVPFWPPGLPLYLLPLVAAGAPEVVLRASMLLFWGIACWGIWRLARAVGIGNYAWLVLLVFSVMPSSIQMSMETQTQEPVAALLLVALGSAVLCGQGAGLGEYAILGCSLGLMALMRPSALPLLGLLPAVCLLVSRRTVDGGADATGDGGAGAGSGRRWGGPVLSVALGCALVGAWVVRAHELCGAWLINNSNAANLYYGNNPWTPMYKTWYFGTTSKLGSPEIRAYPAYERVLQQAASLPPLEASAYLKGEAVAYIEHRPDMFALRTLNRVRCFFGFDTFTSTNLRWDGDWGRRLFPVSLALEAVLYLAVAGPALFWLAMAPRRFWRRWQSWMIAGAIVVYAVPYWLSMSHPTYHYPIVMPLAILGVMAWKVWDGQGGPRAGVRLRGWVAVAVLACIQVEWVWQMVGSLQR